MTTPTRCQCQSSQRLCRHAIFENIKLFFPKLNNLLFVSVVNNYAATRPRSHWIHGHVLKKSMTTLTQCPLSCWLRWHDVRVLVDYADTSKPFLPVHMGPRWSFWIKKCWKSRDTVPLSQGGRHILNSANWTFCRGQYLHTREEACCEKLADSCRM